MIHRETIPIASLLLIVVLFPTNEEQHIYLDRASFFCLKSSL